MRGIIAPLVMVSTRMRKGIIDKTLWWDENGAKETRSTSHLNFDNYAHSILILMLWILPINVLVHNAGDHIGKLVRDGC
jgi:hypothetical protein